MTATGLCIIIIIIIRSSSISIIIIRSISISLIPSIVIIHKSAALIHSVPMFSCINFPNA